MDFCFDGGGRSGKSSDLFCRFLTSTFDDDAVDFELLLLLDDDDDANEDHGSGEVVDGDDDDTTAADEVVDGLYELFLLDDDLTILSMLFLLARLFDLLDDFITSIRDFDTCG